MTNDQSQDVRDRIEGEGFDYCFRYYSEFPEIEDKEFHRLRDDYKKAAQSLADYVGLEE